MSDTLSFTVDGTVAEITLTRPEVLNRFDSELHRDFTDVLVELRRRTDLRAVVLEERLKDSMLPSWGSPPMSQPPRRSWCSRSWTSAGLTSLVTAAVT